jgi:DNA-binding IclR family transcriptional regulator
VLDPAGSPAGGISVAGPTPLLAGRRRDRIRDQVVAAAATISRRLASEPGP